MQVKIKKLHKDAVVPKYAKPGDAGLDLTATTQDYEPETGCLVYGTGLSFEIPQGYVGLLFPRSSLSKYDLLLSNHVGVIDSSFRGEICFKFKNLGGFIDQEGYYENKEYNVGDRIGQLLIIPYPQIELVEVDNLSETERGTGGYGSSGS